MNPVRNKKINIFVDLHASLISNGAKKTSIILTIALVMAALPGVFSVAHAAATDCGATTPGAQLVGADPSTGQGGTWVCPNGSYTSPTGSGTVTPTPAAQVPNTSGQPCGANCNLPYVPLEPIPGITSGDNGQALNFPNLLGNIYKVAIIIGALFSVVMLTINGVRYMLSDVLTTKTRALQRIWACIYGLILIAGSWLILNTINPQLVKFNLSPQSVSVSSGQSAPIGGAATPTAQQLEAAKQAQEQAALNTPVNSAFIGAP